MRKFIIHTVKGQLTVMEIECEKILPLEDPSVLWSMKPGEYRARILKPGIFTSAIWCSFAIYDTFELASEAFEKLTREKFDFEFRKHGTAFTEEDVQTALVAANTAVFL